MSFIKNLTKKFELFFKSKIAHENTNGHTVQHNVSHPNETKTLEHKPKELKDWKLEAKKLGQSWANLTFYLCKTKSKPITGEFLGKRKDIFLYYEKLIADLEINPDFFADEMMLAAEDRWYELVATENYTKTSINKFNIN
jgi:hypothetical protein